MKRRGYVLLRFGKEGIWGYCEESFAMSFMPDRVRVWREWEGRTRIEDSMGNYRWIKDRNKLVMFLQEKAEKLRAMNPEDKFEVFRIGSKNCPVAIDWDEFYQEAREKGKASKVSKRNWRNLKFSARECIKVRGATES